MRIEHIPSIFILWFTRHKTLWYSPRGFMRYRDFSRFITSFPGKRKKSAGNDFLWERADAFVSVENFQFFPFFFDLLLRISTSGLLAAPLLSRAKISIMTRKSCDGQRYHLLSRLYFSLALIPPLIKKPSLSPLSYLCYHALAKTTLFIVLGFKYRSTSGERVRLRGNKVALRNLRNNSWSAVLSGSFISGKRSNS